MLGERIQQLRLVQGFSLEALASAMGGIVTKQALSKYEKGKSRPNLLVLNRLAAALGVKAAHLCAEPAVRIEFMAYRKGARVPKREQSRIESLVGQCLEDRVRLQERIGPPGALRLPVQSLPVGRVTAHEMEEIAAAIAAVIEYP